MKLKQRLALMLAVMAAISVAPTFSTLTSGTSVYASESQYSWMSNIVKVTNGSELKLGSSPVATIKEDFGVWEKNHSIYLTVSGGEWTDAIFEDNVLDVRDRNGDVITSEDGESLFEISKDGKRTIAITKKTDAKTPFTLRVPMLVKVGDDTKDDVSLKIEGESTGVRDAEHVFATVSDSKISVRFNEEDDMVKFATRGTTLNPIRIEENFVGSLKKGDQVKFDISRGFEWDNDYTTGPAISIRNGDDTFSLKYDKKKSDETVMVLEVDNVDPDRTRRISFELNDLNIITEDRNSKDYGKVKVDISGKDIEKETITVAEYIDYGADVSVKEEGEFFSGRKVTLPVITLKENVKDSVRFDRPIDIDFPEWVNVIGINSAKLDGKDVTEEFEEGFDITKERLEKEGKDKEFVSSGTVSFDTKDNTSKAIKLEIEFEIETKANADGDIDVTFSGRAFDKIDVVQTVGSVKPVIEVTTDKTNLDVGFKNQEVGNIYIKETEKDAIQKGDILIELDDFMDGRWEKEPVVEVVKGDIRLGEIKLIDKDTLSIEVKSSSRTPATIEISEGVMTTTRAIADGEYDINVFGNAIVDKSLKDSDWEKGYTSPYVTVGIKEESKEKVSFVIGKSNYLVGEETLNMDAAPYIDENGRTMVPVRYVAQAIGISPDNILWGDRTVTIFTTKDQIMQVQVDKPIITLNGADIQMDTTAVIKDGRTYLPISWIARGLDIPYTWDNNTKTVTFQ